MSRVGHRLLSTVWQILDVGQAPEKADCIFVFAGREARKAHGLSLFRQGYAKKIVFSVARFEWRKFARYDLVVDGSLRRLVEATPAKKRHFFVSCDGNEVHVQLTSKGRFGTLSESLAFSELARRQNIVSTLVVSSPYHLRRAVGALEHMSRHQTLTVIPVACPEAGPEEDGTQTASPGMIAAECLKNVLYRFLLLPAHSLFGSSGGGD
jgi:hypothetical protein